MKDTIIIKQQLPMDNPPHPDDSPILIHYDCDMGWIVEKVFDGEYEIQNLPAPWEKHDTPNIELANDISDGREIWIAPKN